MCDAGQTVTIRFSGVGKYRSRSSPCSWIFSGPLVCKVHHEPTTTREIDKRYIYLRTVDLDHKDVI
jgi:hypothetical protein